MRNTVRCPFCKSLFSEEHRHCPFCGARRPSITVKYIGYGALAIAIFSLLVYLILSYQA